MSPIFFFFFKSTPHLNISPICVGICYINKAFLWIARRGKEEIIGVKEYVFNICSLTNPLFSRLYIYIYISDA